MRTPPRTNRRAGWQLIELSFVLGTFALISVAATRLIIGLMAIENRCGREVEEGAILNRLAEQWRADLHRSSSTTISGDAELLQLELPAGRQVKYRIEGEKLSREQVDEGQRGSRRETYAVTARKWRFDRTGDGSIVTLVCESPPAAMIRGAGSEAPSRIDTVEAAIGILATSSGSPVAEGASP